MILSVCRRHCGSKYLVSLNPKSWFYLNFRNIKVAKIQKEATYHVANEKIVDNLYYDWSVLSFKPKYFCRILTCTKRMVLQLSTKTKFTTEKHFAKIF